jgi:hypothetical protein
MFSCSFALCCPRLARQRHFRCIKIRLDHCGSLAGGRWQWERDPLHMCRLYIYKRLSAFDNHVMHTVLLAAVSFCRLPQTVIVPTLTPAVAVVSNVGIIRLMGSEQRHGISLL